MQYPEDGYTEVARLPGPSAPISRAGRRSSHRPDRGRILVMDDETILLDFVTAALRRFGHEAVGVLDGRLAIDRYREAYSAGRPFHAVILDLSVPGGLGGKEAVYELRRIDPDVKAIVASGNCHDDVVLEYEKHGFISAVSKPFNIRELLTVVCAALGLDA